MLGAGDSLGAQRELHAGPARGARSVRQPGPGRRRHAPEPLGRRRQELHRGARLGGTPEVTAAAELRSRRGRVRQAGRQRLQAAGAGRAGGAAARAAHASRAGALLYVVTGIAVAEKDWPGALGSARRLVDDYPAARGRRRRARARRGRCRGGLGVARRAPGRHAAAPALSAQPVHRSGRRAGGRGAARDGQGGRGQREIDQVLAAQAERSRASDPAAGPRARVGRRPCRRARRLRARRTRWPGAGARTRRSWATAALLVEDKRWSQARGVFEQLLKSDDKATVAEAARGIGETLRRRGRPARGRRVLPDRRLRRARPRPQGRKALLAAGQSFAAAQAERGGRHRLPQAPGPERSALRPRVPLARVSPPSPGDTSKIAGP